MNPLKPVSDLMSIDLITVHASSPIAEARKLFADHNIHHLIVESPDGQIEGILSERDLLSLIDTDSGSRNNMIVSDIMTKGLAKLERGDSVRTAANLFALNKFHALPVVEDNKAIGILTTHDLIKLLDAESVELRDYLDMS
ncbi:MAG: CBS domain-containing protein [Bacteroidota bacterium]